VRNLIMMPCARGVAYRIEAENYADVKAYLDHREQGGYSIVHMDVYADHGKPIVFGVLGLFYYASQ